MFSNTPQNSTYRTEQIKFDAAPTLRSPDNTVRRDSHIINLFYESIRTENVHERDLSLTKRPGTATTSTSLNKVVNTDSIRGYMYEEQEDIYFWAVANKVYKYIPNPAGSYTSLVATLATSSGDVVFNTFKKSTGETYVLFSDGTNLWSQQLRVYPDTAAASVADPDLPTPHNPMFTTLDGYVFVSKGNTIYNSNVDTFDTWTAGDDLDAEMSADDILALFRSKNYVVAMGYNSMEMFFDAHNASGSPLERNDVAFKSIGYIGGFATQGDQIFYVGQMENDNICIYLQDGFKVDRISDDVVERTLQSVFTTTYGSSRVVGAKGHVISVDGHTFYMLCTSEITWVYDTELKFWYEWRTSTGPLLVEAAWSKFNGGQYIAIKDASAIDKFSNLVYNDNGVNFTTSYTTEDNLFGSVNWKTCNRAAIVCDRHIATGTSNVVLQWSDDDWADGSTPTGSANMNVFSNMPFARRLGRFRNRSFRILYTDNYPIRFKYLELELNIGSH